MSEKRKDCNRREVQREYIREQIAVMERYIALRLAMRDWHGVMDAAADIRELEAKLGVVDLDRGREP
jgi:hypothetical protein